MEHEEEEQQFLEEDKGKFKSLYIVEVFKHYGFA